MIRVVISIVMFGSYAYAANQGCLAIIGSEKKQLKEGGTWTIGCTTIRCAMGQAAPEDAGCRDQEAGCKALGEIWTNNAGKEKICTFNVDKYEVGDVSPDEAVVVAELAKEEVKEVAEAAKEDEKIIAEEKKEKDE